MRISALILAMFFAGNAQAQETQPPENPSDQQTERSLQYQHQQGRTQQPDVAQNASTTAPQISLPVSKPKNKEEATDYKETGTEFWPAFLGYRLKITDTLITGFTALLFLATWLLWRATKKLVNGADDTAKRQLRAYVSVNPKVLSNFGVASRVTIEFLTKNHGQTPARDINHVFDIAVLPNPLPNDFEFPAPSIPLSQDQGLFPVGEMKTWFYCPRLLTTDEIDAIESDKSRLHVWGTTFYQTAFGTIGRTPFNASVGGEAFANSVRAVHRGKPDPGFSWAYGPGHNQAE